MKTLYVIAWRDGDLLYTEDITDISELKELQYASLIVLIVPGSL